MSDQLDYPVYFLTWTTHGTWLPGDERGWVDRARSGPLEPIREPDDDRLKLSNERLTTDAVVLDERQRELVETTIAEVCTHRDWTLYAANCRTNHVHTVLLAIDREPEFVMNSLKSWCSRRLNESRGSKSETPWWTRHGSTRWLNTVSAFEQTVDYVVNRQ